MFKKIISLCIILVLAVCVCGCGNPDDNNPSQEVEIIYQYDDVEYVNGGEQESTESSKQENTQGSSNMTSNSSSQSNESTPQESQTQENTDNGYSLTDASVLSQLKLNGRTQLTADGVVLDFSASSIEFKANCSGNVYIEYTTERNKYWSGWHYADMYNKYDKYFAVYVDGKETQARTVLEAGGALILARELTAGEHTFKIICETEAGAGPLTTFKKIGINGNLVSVKSDAPVIEFLGDSLTSGRGNLCKNGTLEYHTPVYESSIKAYPYLIAHSLGYDYRIVSKGGIGLKAYGNMPDFLDFYKAQNYDRDKNTPYISQSVSDVEIVVVNLGTNDEGTAKIYDSGNADTVAKYSQHYADLITTIGYDKDTKILFLAGVGGCTGYYNSFEGAKQLLNAAGYGNVYTYKANRYMSGGGLHPTADEHKLVAEEIIKVLKKNGIV